MAKKSSKVLATESIPPKVIKMTEELSCDLNEVQWQNRAREMADAQERAEKEEQRKKDVTKQLNADVAVAKNKVSKLASVVATRREQREVVVEITYDYEKGTVSKRRTDTDEVIDSREMTDNERQGELDLLDANAFIADRHEKEPSVKDEAEDGDESDIEEEA